jgi:hypothetical protein
MTPYELELFKEVLDFKAYKPDKFLKQTSCRLQWHSKLKEQLPQIILKNKSQILESIRPRCQKKILYKFGLNL